MLERHCSSPISTNCGNTWSVLQRTLISCFLLFIITFLLGSRDSGVKLCSGVLIPFARPARSCNFNDPEIYLSKRVKNQLSVCMNFIKLAVSYIQCISNIATQTALAVDGEFNLIYKYRGVVPVLK